MAGTSAPAGKRRLLMVIDLLFWAGAETQLRHLAIGLQKLDFEVTLVASDDATSYVADLDEAGVELRVLGAKSRGGKLRALPEMTRLARRSDLVHCTGWDASLWGRLAAIAARRPAVVTEHTAGRDFQVSRSGAPRGRLIALHNRYLDRFTYATVVVADAQVPLLESEGIRPESIVRIPNAVPLAELRQRAGDGIDRASLGVPPEATLIVHAARFTPPKGQPVTLRAVAQMRERLGDVRVLFAGAGPEEEKVKHVAEELDADWATFLGSRDDVPGLLRAADLAVLPSTAEGLPMSLIESMAVGTPVVATDVGDVRWLIDQAGGGICVAEGDEAAFAEACEQVLGDNDLRRRLGEAGAVGATEFDAPRMAERYAEVFEAAITSGALPSLLICIIPIMAALMLVLALRLGAPLPRVS
jgi:glycosyltransferase involved in cell wall biosynthesis